MVVHKLTSLSELYKDKESLMVIDFHASWCNPCQIFAPKFLEMSEKVPHVIFYEVSVEDEEARPIIEKFAINAMPTIVFFKNGQTLLIVYGAGAEEIMQMRQALSQYSF